jgi:hypothetical protein
MALLSGLPVARGQESTLRWRKTFLDRQFRAEGAAVADVNRDGRSDILVGDLWYEAPGWNPHRIRAGRAYEPATGYSEAFLVFAWDVDRDLWPDEVVVGFPGAPARWYRNPGSVGTGWEGHVITESACNESPLFTDLDGNGVPELVSPHRESRMAFYTIPGTPGAEFTQHLIGGPGLPGCGKFSHGLGAGDLDGDGQPEILCPDGFYRASRDPLTGAVREGNWTFLPARLGAACAQMYTHDFNGDGRPDVISSSAHGVGVWWHEQLPPGPEGPAFRQHAIDTSFSQSHSLMQADLNGDGQPDYVTGKRYWAHGPNGDVAPNDPAVLFWFEFRYVDGQVRWLRHEIDRDSGVGTGFAVTDINGDSWPDVVVANKKGVFLFEQVRPGSP